MKLTPNPGHEDELQLLPSSGESSYKVDTKANILSSTPTAGNAGFASDTLEMFIGTGTVWEKMPFKLIPESANPNMGMYPNTGNNIGFSPTYVSNKVLENITIGYSNKATPDNGDLRITSANYLEVYLNGVWNKIVMNFVFLEDSANGYTFEHKPVGFNTYIEVMSGNSINSLGLNGLPLIQQYRVDMGAYPSRNVLGGRQF